MSLETAAALFGELAEVDDLRLTLAGVGDPLLYEPLFDVIDAAASAGIKAISVETDLLDVKADRLGQLARSAVDVVSVQLPAVTAQTYAAVMGVDGMQTVLANLKEFFERRNGYGRLTPMVVPTFAKCRMNLAEMETWYDQWIRAIGAAVIVGPSDYCGKIPDAGVADMSPPLRRACGRLARRMTILSDGVVVSCEQDVTGERAMGTLPEDSIVEIWQKKFGALRADHGGGNWDRHALCAGCKEWHRP
jgi:spiro-SPASM protein